MIEVIAYHIDVPEDLLAVLMEDGFVAECSRHGYEVAATSSPEKLEARLDELAGKFDWRTSDHATGPDRERLAALLAEAKWEPRPDYGEGVEVAYHTVDGPLADALEWECSSCREDVGWADWTRAERTVKPDEEGRLVASPITIYVECGHCGADYRYDAEGNDLGYD